MKSAFVAFEQIGRTSLTELLTEPLTESRMNRAFCLSTTSLSNYFFHQTKSRNPNENETLGS